MMGGGHVTNYGHGSFERGKFSALVASTLEKDGYQLAFSTILFLPT
jgi:hypothetical protein